ncbi:MAG: dTDP-4-dehydrorhamnose reductase [bacterium]|nr:dTDP-4-dehydrorhamnose reductase [candidate division KSB1 bacterium]MDH7558758.1 dTDP-4-dehydrorhamnose reductase [bacterium]
MKVLLTGCNGLLGQNLVAHKPAAIELLGVDLADSFYGKGGELEYHRLDLRDRSATKGLVTSVKPAWVIHTAGYNNVDGAEAEKEACWQGNVVATENLAWAAESCGAHMLHLSTDYIFDGRKGPYAETARPNPLGYYGKSKLAAENAVKGSAVPYVIVRTMVLYGHGQKIRDNFATWLLRKLGAGEEVKIVTDQMGNTTLASELAQALWRLVLHGAIGIYHVAGSEIVSRYDFALTLAEVFGLERSFITPVRTAELHQAAPRPLRSGLIIEKVFEDFGIRLSGTRDALLRFKEELEAAGSPLALTAKSENA